MSYMNWETALITKAINRTISRKPRESLEKRGVKQRRRQENTANQKHH